MSVIKKIESRKAEIKQLDSIIESVEDEKVQRLALGDLKRVQMAEKAEQNATKVLGDLYKDQKNAILLSGLRFEIDGQVALIDHLAINEHGLVSLFETKHFSTGVKVDSKGRFWRWDGFKKRYVEIASPFKQSELNEPIVKKLLAKLGAPSVSFRHFVVVDYKAKLIKSTSGFDNLCRPDRVKDTLLDANGASGLMGLFKRLTGLFKGRQFNAESLAKLGAALQAQHSPIEVDYWAKYGLKQSSDAARSSAPAKPKSTTENPDVVKSDVPSVERLTMPKLARAMQINAAELEHRLIEQGYMEKRGDKTFVTDQGKAAGIQFRKGRRGFFFLLPARLAEQPDLLNAV